MYDPVHYWLNREQNLADSFLVWKKKFYRKVATDTVRYFRLSKIFTGWKKIAFKEELLGEIIRKNLLNKSFHKLSYWFKRKLMKKRNVCRKLAKRLGKIFRHNQNRAESEKYFEPIEVLQC